MYYNVAYIVIDTLPAWLGNLLYRSSAAMAACHANSEFPDGSNARPHACRCAICMLDWAGICLADLM